MTDEPKTRPLLGDSSGFLEKNRQAERDRFEFAKVAMQTLCWDLETSTQSIEIAKERRRICAEAWAWADAMLKARDEK